MSELKKITTALISVYYKEGLEKIIHFLHGQGVVLYSTGGTSSFIESLGIPVLPVEGLTGYPSILGGRVKTLHPKVFGGILGRREIQEDVKEMEQYDIPALDLVMVDLYPFSETVAAGATADEIIEKIDIGGISLIRAAAKNYRDVVIVSDKKQYNTLLKYLEEQSCQTSLEQRREFAAWAFHISSSYDTEIHNYFNRAGYFHTLKISQVEPVSLRYGENPHQQGYFFGSLKDMFEQLHGKEISYNNLLDMDAAVSLMNEFEGPTFAIIKHNNACGVATRESLPEAWRAALAGDPVSAFGGVLITNEKIDRGTAAGIDQIFFELIMAPAYDPEALTLLKKKKNRIILVRKTCALPSHQFRSALNGILVQEKDQVTENVETMKTVTDRIPSPQERKDLLFANRIVKHTKSNAIVLVKDQQLVGSGTGQTSRVDALKQAIEKAGSFQLPLAGAVMASDAFFPFADSVEIAWKAGIKAVIQPGGSIRDQDSVDYCNKMGMSMIFTGIRHFKH